jgi:hypothetical protein
MFGALIRAAERRRGLRFTEFELRRIAAVRKELDAEYESKLTPSGPVIPPTLFQQIWAVTNDAGGRRDLSFPECPGPQTPCLPDLRPATRNGAIRDYRP